MKAFLMSLKGFSVSIGGLIVVIVAVLIHGNIISIIQNPPTFNLATLGSYLGLIILLFAVVWAQMKSNALLSHGILFYLFASSLSAFLGQLFSNTPGNAFTLDAILSVVMMLYALGVVLAFVLYDRPKPEKLTALASLPFLIYFGVYYVHSGFNGTVISLLVVLLALMLGSKMVALAFALFTITGPMFTRLYLIIETFSNNLEHSVNTWFVFAALVVAFVFLTLDFVKTLKANEA